MGTGVPIDTNGGNGTAGGDSFVKVAATEIIRARGGGGGGGAVVVVLNSIGGVGAGGPDCPGAQVCTAGQYGKYGMWNYTSNTSVQSGQGGASPNGSPSNGFPGGGGDAGNKYSDLGGPYSNGDYNGNDGGHGRVIIYY